jgi:hypothetical protein
VCSVAVGARNSTASRVAVMKASSSEASWAVSSSSVIPAAPATRPTSSVLSPEMVKAPSPAGETATLGERSRGARAAGSVRRTSTRPRPAPATNSAMPVSAISRPRPMTMRCWAVMAI